MLFTLGIVLIIAGILVSILATPWPKFLRTIVLVAAAVVGIVAIIGSTMIFVGAGQGGIVTIKFGRGLENGRLVAVNGEKGPQADVLPPGYHFGYFPWNFNLEAVPNMNVPEGSVGVVVALDGKSLPSGEIYAPAWTSPSEMLDAKTFLSKDGCKGPQLTVLPPGQYRYNPKLFTIAAVPCIDVQIGEAVAIRANAGMVINTASNEVSVNGVQLVPKGYKGIWNVPLMPNKYYMHPNAYQTVHVKTIKRMYSYTGKGTTEGQSKADRPHMDASIPTRSKDGFGIPVDVRAIVSIKPENVPYVAAKFGNPDLMSADGFDTIETLAILPSLRAILRNAAQDEGAIEFVQKRTVVEQATLTKFRDEMAKDKIDVEAVYLADIRLDATPEGQALLKTQTDKQIADQQQAMYQQQVKAENERANQVKARAAADMQDQIQKSLAGITVAEQDATAAKKKAEGDAAQSVVYEAKVKALGGVENFTKLEIAKMAFESLGKTWKGDVPSQVIVGGGGSGSLTDVMTGLFAKQLQATGTK